MDPPQVGLGLFEACGGCGTPMGRNAIKVVEERPTPNTHHKRGYPRKRDV